MIDPPRPPSGEQLELRHAGQRAIVVGVGGGLRRYQVDGDAILDGYAADELCPGAAGQPLVPWPNRLGDGSYTLDGATHQLALSEPATATAIHGLGRWARWELSRHSAAAASAALLIPPQTGYPFEVAVRIAYELADTGLTVTATAHNHGARPAPWGIGFHPYLAAGPGLVDDLRLLVPARRRLPLDARGLPTGKTEAAPAWLGRGEEVGDRRLDDCLTDFGAADGTNMLRAVVSGRGAHDVAVWADASLPYMMVFSGDTLAEERRRRGLAVEPMSCPPDAFRSGEGLILLEPGAEVSHRWGLVVTPAG